MPAENAAGRRGVVATVHPLASRAAIEAFEKGGNAIDAAVAAAVTLGVVDGHNSGVGGGCFLLIRRASGELIAIDGRETAPATAGRNMFVRDGKADAQLSQTGALAVGVPGALAAYDYAVRRFGKLSGRDLLLPAAKTAEDGFSINRQYAQRLEATATELRLFDGARVLFMNDKGEPWKTGDVLRQTDLAKTYRSIAEEGIDWFYHGVFAHATADWMKSNGGLVTVDDFRQYRVKQREPVRTTYRGHEIVGFPPPSSGGAHVAQILNILEHFDLKSMGAGSADFIHVVAEAMKLAFADRAYWLGDPDFVNVPRGLVSRDYSAKLAGRIRLDRSTAVAQHGAPDNAASDVFGKHTTHFSTADSEGNWVACTATINTSFGSKVVVPGTGVLLNNQMDDFSAQPGAPNYFGLIGAEANAVAPGKRPLSSMSPALVLKNGQPVLSVGAAGGPTIISQVVLAIIGVVDFGMDPGAALAQPRFHHQWKPDEIVIEKRVGEDVARELEKRGHTLKRVDAIGAAQAVGWDSVEKRFIGAHDPRVEGNVSGW
ncbi:MAG TPA: gamma-glutamyltransferase [Verrucomicrobiae bacterium]|nr:gamma-glutamyltransferase [Verrucomicrobiae bacterium]